MRENLQEQFRKEFNVYYNKDRESITDYACWLENKIEAMANQAVLDEGWREITNYLDIPEHTHILLTDGKTVDVGNRNARGITIFGKYPYCYYHKSVIGYTHWMPLPEPPTFV